jgi:hypothetical protein
MEQSDISCLAKLIPHHFLWMAWILKFRLDNKIYLLN